MRPFTERVIHLILHIPEGHVMTYGQIARLAGSPRGARQVVRILHSMSVKYQLPWHRVVNAKGEIGFKEETAFLLQKQLLENEGIKLTEQHLIELSDYQFYPREDHEEEWL
ncbi:MGMT family protein [Metabacillus niabensis]|uniref:MGMT family protein n=1 Tax=Metabacillus niabensis TaxID=324854 RepID=UPI001CFB06F6|nr:MGMT family protein [Metabacillus niabensis]